MAVYISNWVFKLLGGLMEVNDILYLLADSTRMRILKILKKGEKNVSKIVEALKLSQPTVSHHLRRLEEAGLVLKRQYKRWVFYQVNKSLLKKFIKSFGVELDL
jgi:DNA-binding transcriptional ArsR family regulator